MQAVEDWVHLNQSKVGFTLLEGSLQPVECLVFVLQAGVKIATPNGAVEIILS